MTDDPERTRTSERATPSATPSAAPESAKVHGDALEELIPRTPRERSAAAASSPPEENEQEEPRGHS